MRRLMLLLTAGLAVVAFGCSSSEDTAPTTTAPSSTTTSSVVVSAANKPTCDAIAGFKTAADADLAVEEGGDPTENTTKIQAFMGSLITPLQAVQAVAPAELQPSLTTLIAQGEDIVALDPTKPDAQSQIANAIMAPPSETTAAQKVFYTWSADNCGISLE